MPNLPTHDGSFNATSVIVIVTSTLSLYNALELILLIFTTFKAYRGLYFWSLLVASFGIIPYNLGFLVVFFDLTRQYAGFIVDSYGWITMVTGQSVVLYSRLHLVLQDPRILRAVLWMIVVDAVVFHVSTTVVLFGSSYGGDEGGFNTAWTVIEKVQMTAFCIQEFIISGLYVYETVRLLKVVSGGHTRRTMWQLFGVNVIIIVLDVALLVVEYRNLRVYEQAFKGVVYSIKLKLEFAILGKLVQIVRDGGRVMSDAVVVDDTATYVDRNRTPSDVTHAESHKRQARRGSRSLWMKKGVDEADVEHIESADRRQSSRQKGGVEDDDDGGDGDDGGGPRGIEEMMKDFRMVTTSHRRTDSDSLYADALRQISR